MGCDRFFYGPIPSAGKLSAGRRGDHAALGRGQCRHVAPDCGARPFFQALAFKKHAATAVVQNKATIQIAIDESNRLFMDHREIDPRAVRANVERALAENPEGAVVVVADKASSTGVAIQVMDGCRMAGATHVSLAASVPQGG